MLVLKGSSFLQDGDLRVRWEDGVEQVYYITCSLVLREYCLPSAVPCHSDGMSVHRHYRPGSLPSHNSALISHSPSTVPRLREGEKNKEMLERGPGTDES